MSVVATNIAANLFGKLGSALITFCFVPLYIGYLGPEAFGLVGVQTTLQALFLLADAGLSYTLTRETARLSASASSAQDLRDLFRTFELLFLSIGGVVMVAAVTIAPYLATEWVQTTLPTGSVQTAIMLIAVNVGLQFPILGYQGGLIGFQRHVSLNGLLFSTALIRASGAIAVFYLIAPTLEVFFAWHVVMSIMQALAGRALVFTSLADELRGRFRCDLVRTLWRFAAGMSAISLTSAVLMNLDKVILSKMLSLEEFGFYTLAGLAAGVPGLVGTPVSSAVYPRFTQLVANSEWASLVEMYHRSCQILAVLLLPTGLLIATFPREILFVWTGNADMAERSYLFLRLLVLGSTLLGLMLTPYSLQLAFGWTGLLLKFNAAAIVALVPLTILLTKSYGAVGACFGWLSLNTAYVTLQVYLLHRRLLKSEYWTWCFDDFLKPLLGALGPLVLALTLIPLPIQRFWLGLTMVAFWGISFASAGASSKSVRRYAVNYFRGPWCKYFAGAAV